MTNNNLFDNYQLPNVNSLFNKRKDTNKIPLLQVDKLADDLVKEYKNPKFKAWYCGVINKFGISRVLEWQNRSRTGKSPGKIFTIYVNQAGGYRKGDKTDANLQ